MMDPVFNSDSTNFAYVVQGAEDNRDRMVFSGLESNLYDDVFAGSLCFVDEQSVEFVVRNGQRFLQVTETLK